MPAGLHHPLSRALYERHGDGQIKVTDGGRNGIFTSQISTFQFGSER